MGRKSGVNLRADNPRTDTGSNSDELWKTSDLDCGQGRGHIVIPIAFRCRIIVGSDSVRGRRGGDGMLIQCHLRPIKGGNLMISRVL